MALATKPLDTSTWSDLAHLAGEHRGVWDGCWCLGFHEEGRNGVHTPAQRRALKEARVREGSCARRARVRRRAVRRVVPVRPTEELPRIKLQKAYQEGLRELPDWRITCFSSGEHIVIRASPTLPWPARWWRLLASGGGTVESYPEDTSGRKVSGSFLFNGSVAMFERHGFTRCRQIGKHRWVVSRLVG